jgi:hypothetical protein
MFFFLRRLIISTVASLSNMTFFAQEGLRVLGKLISYFSFSLKLLALDKILSASTL